MYIKNLIVDDENEISKHIKDLKDDEAIQLYHKDDSVKVIITQEYYFNMLAKLESTNNGLKSTKYNPKHLMKNVKESISSIKKAIYNHEKNKKQGISRF